MLRPVGVVAVALLFAAPLAAQVNFDDLPSGAASIASPYNGLTWDNFWAVDGCASYALATGYCNGTISGDNVAFNGFADPATISSASPFLFGGAWFTGAWNDGLSLDISGWFDGSVLFSTTLTLNYSTPLFFAANWANIDELRFNSYGGSDANANDNASGLQFVMDDLYLTPVETDVVPEPATMTLLATGLAGMVASRRRRKA